MLVMIRSAPPGPRLPFCATLAAEPVGTGGLDRINERFGGRKVLNQLLARKSVATITRQAESGPRLSRVLGVRALTSIGLGSMIGSGVFVLSGTVAAEHT